MTSETHKLDINIPGAMQISAVTEYNLVKSMIQNH